MLPEPADAYSVSPPYRDEEEPPAEPAVDPQDSVSPADAEAEKATPVSAHPDESSADAAVREYSEDLEPKAAARPARSLEVPPSPQEFWEPRPYRAVAVVSVPTKSGPASVEALASLESPRRAQPREPQVQASMAEQAHVPPEEPEAQRAEQEAQARRAAPSDAATVSMAARTRLRSTKEAAAAVQAARAQPPEHLRRVLLAVSL